MSSPTIGMSQPNTFVPYGIAELAFLAKNADKAVTDLWLGLFGTRAIEVDDAFIYDGASSLFARRRLTPQNEETFEPDPTSTVVGDTLANLQRAVIVQPVNENESSDAEFEPFVFLAGERFGMIGVRRPNLVTLMSGLEAAPRAEQLTDIVDAITAAGPNVAVVLSSAEPGESDPRTMTVQLEEQTFTVRRSIGSDDPEPESVDIAELLGMVEWLLGVEQTTDAPQTNTIREEEHA